MIWRLFTKSARQPPRDEAWWSAAEQAATEPEAETIARLRNTMDTDAPLDEIEQQEEMVDGLEQLQTLAVDALPVMATQHRVIGDDVCHLALPATLEADQAVPGKLFLTSRRLVFAGGRAQSWPWHRIRGITRQGRGVLVVLGGSSGATLQCNTYGDAIVVAWIGTRLASPRSSAPRT